MLSVFCSPSRYVQGAHATLKLGEELVFLGFEPPALIIASKAAAETLHEKWKKAFSIVNFSYFVYPFGGECSLKEIENIKIYAKEKKAKIIIGAGGGKVLDASRAAAADLLLPIVNCPTIASSDAPCSALSVIYTKKGEFEKYRFYRKNPDLVLVDTETISKAPARFLIAGMGDALATLFEAKTCYDGCKKNMRGGAPSLTSFHLAQLCYKTLLEDGVAALHALKARTVNSSLERIVEANTLLSGLGFESCGLAAAHAIHNGLTTISETHAYLHGEKVAFGTLVQLVLEGKDAQLLKEVLNFSFSVGLPMTLQQIGIQKINDEILTSIAKRTLQEGETIYNEPFEISLSSLKDAIRSADELGRSYLEKRRC